MLFSICLLGFAGTRLLYGKLESKPGATSTAGRLCAVLCGVRSGSKSYLL